MGARFKKVAVIMLACLIGVAGLIQVHNAFASPESAAKADNNKAAAMLQQMMTKMDSMSKMPMSATEKQMMQMMRQMADMIKMLIDVNKNLIAAIEHGTK